LIPSRVSPRTSATPGETIATFTGLTPPGKLARPIGAREKLAPALVKSHLPLNWMLPVITHLTGRAMAESDRQIIGNKENPAIRDRKIIFGAMIETPGLNAVMKQYDLYLAVGRSGSVLQRRDSEETSDPCSKSGKQNIGGICGVADNGVSRKQIPHAAPARSGDTPPRGDSSVKEDIDGIGYRSGGDHADSDGRVN